MNNLFVPADEQSILERLGKLQPGAHRQWGKMNAAQALTHCSRAIEVATGDLPLKQGLFGKVLSPFVRGSLLGDKPFPKNSPTDPAFVVTDEREFEAARRHLVEVIARFCRRGPDEAAKRVHSFLGRMSGDDWGVMMYKHVDHHLRQFGG
jgi:hypothetical protein